jgi:hypothetical protein
MNKILAIKAAINGIEINAAKVGALFNCKLIIKSIKKSGEKLIRKTSQNIAIIPIIQGAISMGKNISLSSLKSSITLFFEKGFLDLDIKMIIIAKIVSKNGIKYAL